MIASSRFRFAAHYALRHLLLSLGVALASAAVVFGQWYPAPYRQMLDVGHIYLLVLAVDDLKIQLQLGRELQAFRNFAEFEQLAGLAVRVGKQGEGLSLGSLLFPLAP